MEGGCWGGGSSLGAARACRGASLRDGARVDVGERRYVARHACERTERGHQLRVRLA